MNFCQDVPYKYMFKVRQFEACTSVRLERSEENIEVDDNLDKPLPFRNRVHALPWKLLIKRFASRLDTIFQQK